MISTSDQMSQIDKEVEQKKSIEVKSKTSSEKLSIVRIDDEESSSSSSMSLYNIESNEKTLRSFISKNSYYDRESSSWTTRGSS